jgi:hypothetical protein
MKLEFCPQKAKLTAPKKQQKQQLEHRIAVGQHVMHRLASQQLFKNLLPQYLRKILRGMSRSLLVSILQGLWEQHLFMKAG